MTATPLIDSERVTAIFEACVWHAGDEGASVEAESISAASFALRRLADHRAEIAEMLAGLPAEFKRSVGGGWSFLNGCTDANGDQWTGLQAVVEQLFLLGTALGYVKLVLPRDMWSALPGGMPFYVVEDSSVAGESR